MNQRIQAYLLIPMLYNFLQAIKSGANIIFMQQELTGKNAQKGKHCPELNENRAWRMLDIKEKC